MNSSVDLSLFSVKDFNRGAGRLKEFLWLIIQSIVFLHLPCRLYALKRWILRRFGAQIGRDVVIKPGVKITFPWKLHVGDNSWLGEECWLLNMATITIEDNSCISQRAMLCTGNHNYKLQTFDLEVKPIRVGKGAWIAASAWVGPGVTIGSHAVLTAGSVASRNLEPYGVYQGNPAVKIHERDIILSQCSLGSKVLCTVQ